MLDAQYWGVPQRRRRIALVVDFGGDTAGEILFERQSVCRDIDTGEAERERTAEGIGMCSDATSGRTYCIQGNAIDRSDRSGCCGKGWTEDICYTLNTADRHAICAAFKLGNSEKARSIGYAVECAPTLNAECGGNEPAILDMTHACDVIRDCGKIVPTLQSRMGTGGNQVPLVFDDASKPDVKCYNPWDSQSARIYDANGIFHSLNANENGGQSRDSIFCEKSVDNIEYSPDISRTLLAKSACSMAYDYVRRLTPLECERLQGFPDGWTDIDDYIDSNGRKRKTSDSARYKALGNSIAIPPWTWVLNRICGNYDRSATMASLFDGIGGFPLIWERINGDGSCLWASEIEEFPIAVTRRHFK